MCEQSSTTGAINPAAAVGWPSADKDIERVLAVQGCEFMGCECAMDDVLTAPDTLHAAARRAAASNDQVPCVVQAVAARANVPKLADCVSDISLLSARCPISQTPLSSGHTNDSLYAIRTERRTTLSACRSSRRIAVARHCRLRSPSCNRKVKSVAVIYPPLSGSWACQHMRRKIVTTSAY